MEIYKSGSAFLKNRIKNNTAKPAVARPTTKSEAAGEKTEVKQLKRVPGWLLAGTDLFAIYHSPTLIPM